VLIPEIFMQFLEPGEIEIPHQEKQVLRRREDVIDDFMEEFILIGDKLIIGHRCQQHSSLLKLAYFTITENKAKSKN
jgi:hypothetical protein